MIMQRYGKLVWAVAGALVFFLQAALRDGMDRQEWVGLAIAGVNAVLVWAATDTTLAPWVKNTVGGVLAALLVAQIAIDGGFTRDEWWAMLVAFLTGAGVIADPRRPVHVVEGTTVSVVDNPLAPPTPG